MKITSFELSKKLKELGVNQHTLGYSWSLNPAGNPSLGIRIIDNDSGFYRAFTLDEILEMLPVYLKGHPCATIPEATVDYELKFQKENNYMCNGYSISYYTWRCLTCDLMSTCNKHIKIPGYEHENNPAEAAGQLLVWCIEKGHVKKTFTSEELNQLKKTNGTIIKNPTLIEPEDKS